MPLILGSQSASAAAAYDIDNSCMFNDDDSAFLEITPGSTSDGIRQTWTFSCWFKIGNLGAEAAGRVILFPREDASNYSYLDLKTDNTLRFNGWRSGSQFNFVTNQLFRDPSAWYNLVIAMDTTQAVEASRTKIYLNGTQITSFSTEDYPAQDAVTMTNSAEVTRIGDDDGSAYFDGYLAEIAMVTASQLEPTSFGQFNSDSPSIWEPIDISGLTFGTNGYFLDFADSADLGNDVSGNNNDWTSSGLASTDQMTDSPTNNFSTLNPLYKTILTLREGNLLCDNTTATWNAAVSSMAPANGKWYIECKNVAASSEPATRGNIGISDESSAMATSTNEPGFYTNSVACSWSSGVVKKDNVTQYTGTAVAVGDILGIAMDLDNGYVYFADENSWFNSGDPTSGATGTGGISIATGLFYMIAGSGYYNSEWSLNSGNPYYANTSDAADENGYGRFEFAPPTGYYAICSKNLAEFG